jgi:uncharacterized protein
MSKHHGRFVWYELLTEDVKNAETFYRAVLGWETKDSGMSDHGYAICSVGLALIGGIMQIPEDARAMGVGPCWTGYVAVDDVDDTARRAVAASGRLIRAADNIPGVGRFAVVSDPQGAVFILFKGSSDAPPPTAAEGAPGDVGWRELYAADGETALRFYEELFGWTEARALQLNGHGVYRIFAIEGAESGGVMTKMPDAPTSFWLYYFNVEALDAAVERVHASGGRMAFGPLEVPGGAWIAQCLDSQGAMFAVVAPRR